MTDKKNKKTIHIAIMDYFNGSIKLYKHEFPANAQDEEIEAWIEDNTDYKSSSCEYMFSKKPISVTKIKA